MADRYIDYDEVSEYGKHFLNALPSLNGQSNLVDLAKLDALVSNAVHAVETELQKTKSDRSSLRGEREGTSGAADSLRDTIARFYHYLRSLPKTVDIDFNAFFPGQTMGEVANLKPADLASKAADILRGFDTPKNKSANVLLVWKTELDAAKTALSEAIAGKGGAAGDSFVATAALINARHDFLHVYTKVAKPIVRGLLAHLEREGELALFFKDLTVNEGGKAQTPGETQQQGAGTPSPAPVPTP